jgi:hypothetical protein|tara:strand:+ start:2961 stop:3818 length:858 start_codon:yes stop_codon:yes gene_type:complete
MKKLDTVVEDIYKEVSKISDGKTLKVTEKQLDEFAAGMKSAMKHWLTPREVKKPYLRMSNIGRPERQLWYDMKLDPKENIIDASTQIKFLYGHLLEEVVLFLVNLSGHKITDQQKEVKIKGIKGHMDCKIDGEVVDIKSASNFAFRKFKDGTLPNKDSFGYLAQLAGYEEAEQSTGGGFLAINKESGELSLFKPQSLDKPNIKQKIDTLNQQLKKKTPPARCYAPVPNGSYGNMQLPTECKWCPHKFVCHKDANEGKGLRTFKYSTGLTYLTKVVRLPKVEEVNA